MSLAEKRRTLERAVRRHREALLAWRIVKEIPYPEEGTEEQQEVWAERRREALAESGITRVKLAEAALEAFPAID